MLSKVLNTVKSIESIKDIPGIYFVETGDETALYVLSPRSGKLHKIFYSEDYIPIGGLDTLSDQVKSLKSEKVDKSALSGLSGQISDLQEDKADKTMVADFNYRVSGLTNRVSNVEKSKANKSDLENVVFGLRPMGSAATVGELSLLSSPNDGDSYYVAETKDDYGNPYIWRYDRNLNRFVNTKLVAYTELGSEFKILSDKVGGIDDKLSNIILNAGILNVTEEFPLSGGGHYTPAFARYVVPEEYRSPGRMLTYSIADNVWVLERFNGSDTSIWDDPEMWRPVGADFVDGFGDSETAGISQKGFTKYAKNVIGGSVDITSGDGVLDTLMESGVFAIIEDGMTVGHIIASRLNEEFASQVAVGYGSIRSRIYNQSWGDWRYIDTKESNIEDLKNVFVGKDSTNGSILIKSGDTWVSVSAVEDSLEFEIDGLIIPVVDSTTKAWRFVSIDKIGGGTGGNTVNVSNLYPKDGFYTLGEAIAAVEPRFRKKGTVVTFSSAANTWDSYQFMGDETGDLSWNNSGLWKSYGASGTVKKLILNSTEYTPNEDGTVVIPLDQIEVDETLDPESTNPVENRAVAGKVQEIESGTLFASDVELDEETNEATVRLLNKSNAEITSFTIPAGGGGGGGETVGTKIVLTASLDKEVIKEGGKAKLSYFYDHVNVGGEDAGSSTGQKADITVTVRKGSQVLFEQVYSPVGAGNHELDISEYLQAGTIDVFVRAAAADPETGKKQSRQAYASVRVINLVLSSTYNPAANIAGYRSSDTVVVPFTITGTGTKIVTMYLDGKEYDTRTVTRSGTTNSTFAFPVNALPVGRHTVQMVAEVEAGSEVIRSESVYLDILRRGTEENVRYIGAKISFADGRIFNESEHLIPRLEAKQFELLSFDFVAYDSSMNPTSVDVYHNGVKAQTVSVARVNQTYSNRFKEQGDVEMKFVCKDVEYPFFVEVAKSDVDIEEVISGLVLRLAASGRSNSEQNPGTWIYENISTTFENFDWDSNGWLEDALKLTNGASIEIGYAPFASDPTTTGATYEIELECSNVSDREAVILSCMQNDTGFRMTTQEAALVSSGGVTVNTLFAANMPLKVAFVVRNKADNRLIELYVNGIRSGAAQYAADDSFLQSIPANIKLDSSYADILLRTIRVYNRALTDDEVLTNYMADRPTGEEMLVLFSKNDIATEDGKSVDIDKLRAQGKSVMRIVGDVDLVNQTNDKKFEVQADVYFHSHYGKEYDFIARKMGLRIQGTSSTTYPRKNYRLYLDRRSKYGTTLEVNGVDVPDCTYSFKPGACPVPIFCMKADFAESSSTHNTGTAILLDETWKKCGSLTPPQANNQSEYDVRVAVDGFACDMWYDNNDTGINVYLGQYNFNNEKSGSHQVYGFEGVPGFNDEVALNGQRNKCLCVEFLNNSEALCLFTTDNMSSFDDALEFRYKDDTPWADAHPDDRAAVQRVWSWIQACKSNGTKFKNEVGNYFDKTNLCLWYLYTDYFMAVDQRAKNMMLATWDGKIWYFLPYDCDTIFGVRNDGVLKYSYTIDEESFDDSIQSHAYAGHDSLLWKLVRENLYADLASTAVLFRSNMSTSDVLKMYNDRMMANWCERVYNKDSEYKYLKPLVDGVSTLDGQKYYNFLYSLQGSRYAHRLFTVQNRFSLMDAYYVAGTYRSDAFTAYFGHKFSQDNRSIKIVASEKFYFGYGYTSGQPTVSSVPAEQKGDEVVLTFKTDLIVNDPQNIYGASRILELDLTDISSALLQTLNLNGCMTLRRLNASCATGNTALNNILVTNCKGLEELNISGMKSPNFTSMDLTKNSRLRKFDASNTNLAGVAFALGAPLVEAKIPASAQSLEMRSLKQLEPSGLSFENPGSIVRLVVANCDKLDWQVLLETLYNAHYIRVTGIQMEGDIAFLNKYMSKGGIDENGSNTNTCRLVGDYQLTTYVEDDQLSIYRAHFPELNIRQAEYTVIEFDDSVADPANVSNLDNKTGYKYGNDYVPSGHINKILSLRHRVLGKKTAEGEVSYFPLHDEDSNYYADSSLTDSATPSVLTGEQGSVYVYEPRYWFKGVNDIKGKKKYTVFSSNETVSVPEGKQENLSDLQFTLGYALAYNAETFDSAKISETGYGYYIANTEGYKRVRVPTCASAIYGVLFLDKTNKVLKGIRTLENEGFLDGMYLVLEVPDNAERIAFSVNVQAKNDPIVWKTNSHNPVDWEPEWLLHETCLVGAYLGCNASGVLRSYSGSGYVHSSVFSVRQLATLNGSGFNLIDYQEACNIFALFSAKYGTRFAGDKIGIPTTRSYDFHANRESWVTGQTNSMGMTDSSRANPAVPFSFESNICKAINPKTGKAIGYHHTSCLGYESIVGHLPVGLAVGLYIPENESSARKMRVSFRGKVRDVSVQLIPVQSIIDSSVTMIMHQKHLDLFPVYNVGSSSTTFYSSKYQLRRTANTALRLFRGADAWNLSHGFASIYATTIETSEDWNFSCQGRLMFTGKIKRVETVSKFLQLEEV